jgi:hypothetical protein
MPSSQRPKYDWPIRMRFVTYNKKPSAARLPGLSLGPWGRFDNGTRVFQFTLDGLLAN